MEITFWLGMMAFVGPTDKLNGTALGGGFVLGDPTTEKLGGRLPGQAGIVLMVRQFTGLWRLADDVFNHDPGTGPITE